MPSEKHTITKSVIKFTSSVRLMPAISKLEPTYKGPNPIDQVHTNGTVTVLLQPNTTERYNVRRITRSAIASLVIIE
jgi:hypothetical protein